MANHNYSFNLDGLPPLGADTAGLIADAEAELMEELGDHVKAQQERTDPNDPWEDCLPDGSEHVAESRTPLGLLFHRGVGATDEYK